MAVYSLTSSPTTIEDGTHKGIDVTNTGTMNIALSTGDVLKPGAALTICPTGAITATSTPLNWQLGGYSEATTAVDTLYDPVIVRDNTHDNATYLPRQSTAPDPAVMPAYIDSSVSPAALRQWDGTQWVAMATASSATALAVALGG